MAGYKDDKSKVPTEAELEAMLDSESDEDFGQTEPEVASVDQRAVLKEWTAQDFANIYTRFRPHLERHARRFLRNPSQVDEVVQDAFLYLMVTLPELDSELGVLRFLKWKVRLLCLDVIRASGKAYLSDIDEHPEFKADQPEVGSDLERAEDAAIVRMALAKLQPRHREVLIASIYEEKSTLEIAAQVGLTENATRQLMLRARTALKKALVGEVNTQGMSLSQILSVAAKKAAHDAKQVGAQAMSVIAIAVLGIAAFFNFNPGLQTNQVAESFEESTASQDPETAIPSIPEAPVSDEADALTVAEAEIDQGSVDSSAAYQDSAQLDFEKPAEYVQAVLASRTSDLVGSTLTRATLIGGSRASQEFQTNFQGYSLEIFINSDASAFVDLDIETGQIAAAVFVVRTEVGTFHGYARSTGAAVVKSDTGYTTTLVSRSIGFIDQAGRVLSGHPLENATISISIELSPDFSPKFASISLV